LSGEEASPKRGGVKSSRRGGRRNDEEGISDDHVDNTLAGKKSVNLIGKKKTKTQREEGTMKTVCTLQHFVCEYENQ